MRALPFRSRSCAGAIAFYSMHHLPRSALGAVLDEFGRVLTPDGRLVIATHLGDGDLSVDEFLGHPIEPFGATLYQLDELRAALGQHGFVVEREQIRDPLPNEFQGQRLYVAAVRSPRL